METLVSLHPKTEVGDGIASGNAAWSFGGDTPKFFDSHVSKSVPGYSDGHDLVLAVSDFFVKADSTCYELGCSTGALTRKLALRHPTSTNWVGIDIEPNMVAQAKLMSKTQGLHDHNIQFVCDDVLNHHFEPADLMVAYYTLQFIPPKVRQAVISRIYDNLNWGGAFVLFEKVRAPDARFQDITSSIYTDYKLTQGYAPAEVIAKSRSLKGVMEPFSTAGNLDLLRRAGFVDVMTIFKHVCFEGFFCIK